MKLLLAGMAILLSGQFSYAQYTHEYFARAVAIVDASQRSVNEKEYVNQIRIRDFDGRLEAPSVLGYEGHAFKDDGQDHDQVAGDGIYTTTSTFAHSDENPYDPEREEKSVLQSAIVSPDFGYKKQLEGFMRENQILAGPGVEIFITCDVQWCTCESSCGGCYIRMGPIPGCIPCVKFKNCKAGVRAKLF